MSWAVECYWYEHPERGWFPFVGSWGSGPTAFTMVGISRELAIERAGKLARQRRSGRYRYRVRPW